MPIDNMFVRNENNPILSADDLPFPAEAVLNPGVTEFEGDVLLLLRVEDTAGFSSAVVARSKNGVDNWRIEKTPLLQYNLPDLKYETWGCEDPQITYLAEEDRYYIAYTAYSPMGAAVGLARTTDFVDVERVGLVFAPNNKDAALFPEKIGGRWAILHRPDAGDMEHIWIAFSPDLIHWGEPHCVLPEGSGPAWDAVKVGAGPPPMATDEGWLLLYHGVKAYGGYLVYRVGAALLDRDRPHKVLARTPGSLFKAEELYEQAGLVPNVIFPTGWLLRGDDLMVYYGAADTTVCLATVKLKDVMGALE